MHTYRVLLDFLNVLFYSDYHVRFAGDFHGDSIPAANVAVPVVIVFVAVCAVVVIIIYRK